MGSQRPNNINLLIFSLASQKHNSTNNFYKFLGGIASEVALTTHFTLYIEKWRNASCLVQSFMTIYYLESSTQDKIKLQKNSIPVFNTKLTCMSLVHGNFFDTIALSIQELRGDMTNEIPPISALIQLCGLFCSVPRLYVLLKKKKKKKKWKSILCKIIITSFSSLHVLKFIQIFSEGFTQTLPHFFFF